MWNTIALALALFLVLLNGFFVAAEFAIVKIRGTRLDELVRQGNRRARAARRMVDHMDAYLAVTQLGITLASLGLGWIGEPAFAHLIEPLFAGLGTWSTVAAHSVSLTVAFLLITFLHVVFGELAPKSIAIQRAEGTVLWVAWPMHLFYRLSYPAIWALNGIANLALRGVGVRPVSGQERAHSEEELRMILAASQRSGVLTAQEAEILQNVFQFADLTVRQIMIPRGDVITLEATAPVPENLELAKKQSQENPVYYVQYAHARISSILRLARERGIDFNRGDVSLLKDPAELALVRSMLQLPELVETMASLLEPHHLPHYAKELANSFHWFYKQCRVVQDEQPDLTAARLKLVDACRLTLARTLSLMGMSSPETM
jgi:Mg2+/Co2+ transporter CorB